LYRRSCAFNSTEFREQVKDERNMPDTCEPRSQSEGRESQHLVELCQTLREANDLFRKGKKGGREGAIHALEGTLRFYTTVPGIGPEGLNAPLLRLFDAMMALDDGETKPILKAERIRGRHRLSGFSETQIGAAVFTVRKLQETGLPLSEAEHAVAREMALTGAVKSRGSDRQITARTIRGWCERVDQDVGRHGQAAQTFDLLEAEVTNPEKLSGNEGKLFWLERLRSVIARTRGNEA
jgi:hypothetical protein